MKRLACSIAAAGGVLFLAWCFNVDLTQRGDGLGITVMWAFLATGITYSYPAWKKR